MSTTTPSTNSFLACPALLMDHAATFANNAASATTVVDSEGNTTSTATLSIQHVIVHPVVLLQVLDHHSRRPEAGGRVIGTLLGYQKDAGVLEITNAFAVPHAERGDEVAIGKDYNKTMLALHMRSNRKEVVVGWYASAATGIAPDEVNEDGSPVAAEAAASIEVIPPPLIADTSSLIHDFYASETDEGDPIHLIVDTRLQDGDSLHIRAYKSAPVVLQGEHVGNLFHEVRLSLLSNEPEMICMHTMIQQQQHEFETTNGGGPAKETSLQTDVSGPSSLQVSIERLYFLLEQTLKYVDQVVDGKLTADPEMGRLLSDTMATIPRVRPEVLDRLFHDALQDLLMVTYLSNITRTQLTIAEKLNASLGVA